MTRLRVEAHLRGGELHIDTNFGSLDPCCHGDVFAALAVHLGLDGVEMAKAADVRGPGPPDPRFPELRTLILRARRDWMRYGDGLVSEVTRMLRRGKLFPMTPDVEYQLRELFEDHRIGFLARVTGHIEDPARMKRLLESTEKPTPEDPADGLVGLAWRLGKKFDGTKPRRLTAAEIRADAPDMATIVKSATLARLDPVEIEAIRYAQRKAAIYMRRPAMQVQDEMVRVLTEAEHAQTRRLDPHEQVLVAGAVARAVQGRQDDKYLARELREAVSGHSSLTNDMDRVARTELVFAVNDGARVMLREQTKAAGIADPDVWKMVRPRACRECQRIWGPPEKPRIYKLSQVEANDAAGGNFRKPARDWVAVTGPVHPNCTEGPLLLHTPELHDALRDTMATYDAIFGDRKGR